MKHRWFLKVLVCVLCFGFFFPVGTFLPYQVIAVQAGNKKTKKQVKKKKTVSAAVLQLGKKSFTQLCSLCHGTQGYGDGLAAKGLKVKPTAFGKGIFRYGGSFKQIMKSINKGFLKHGMPAYSWMPKKKRIALIHYILFLSRLGKKKKK